MKNMFNNPLDELFNIGDDDMATDSVETGYLQIPQSSVPATINTSDTKDADDIENDRRIDEVYTLAIDAYKQQSDMVEIIDPKFAARNAEVAANFLNIALSAATSKAKIKADRKRSAAFIPQKSSTTNNVIVASQEDILKMIDRDDGDIDA